MAEKTEVAISETSPSTPFSSESRLICRVCQKQFSRYACPRCNARYCSLPCYKRHGRRCTESFMRDNVVGELRQLRPEDETRRKMLDILKRFHQQQVEEEGGDPMDAATDDDDDGNGSTLSEELIQKYLSGDEIKLEDLSPEDVKQFQRAVASGELSKMIEPWNPWWKQPEARSISLRPDGTQLIRFIHEQEEPSLSEIPAGAETPIPPLRHLSSASPSPLLSVHLVDIIYSYCFTLRLYNGDWNSDPLSAAGDVLTVSDVLGNDRRPETVSEAMGDCLEKTCSTVYKHAGGLKLGVYLIDDVVCILSLGRNALICLLCDLQRLLKAGERMVKSEGRRKGESRRKLKNAERKVYFMICWANEQPEEVWASLASVVELEKASVVAVAKGSKQPGKSEGDGMPRSKVLIEEI